MDADTTTDAGEHTGVTIRFSDGRTCPVRVVSDPGAALAAHLPAGLTSVAVIGDARVAGLYGDALGEAARGHVARVAVLAFPPGEGSKTRATKAALEDRMMDAGLGRDTCVVALGGGVSTDLAGFVAATYMRGVPFLSFPTSLMAMVDAAIGGKCGVNTRHGKNLVGAFHQPAAVLLHPPYLRSLPPDELAGGLAEVVKHAMVGRPELLGWLEARRDAVLGRDHEALAHLLGVSAAVKAEVVAADEREAGRREVLNFGHTVGHALEKAVGPSLSHGRAVALGMRVEARVSRALGGLGPDEVARLDALLDALGLDDAKPGLPFNEFSKFLSIDKKNRDGALRLALPSAPGRMMRDAAGRFAVSVDPRLVREAWEAPR